ncbi:MAG: TlpA family protein disulfide reductase [Verrucomicrobiota bacterium]|nr:TlpA family protein disulfide reductase [Verrucomicrobiota bacterium]
MKHKDKIALAVLGTGLLLSSYFTAPASSAGGGCLAILPLSLGDNSVQQIANTGTENRLAPDWQLKDLEGKSVKLSDFKGKVVVLNFWATWCPPCRREIPDFVALQKQYADKGLVVIGVSMDEGGAAVVKPFVKKIGINYPVVLGDQKTAAAYGGIRVVPTTFVIDKHGKVAAQHEGGADRTTFEAEIKPLL